ncbi:hypothetical protein EV361DRAFT_871013 [Lentinula raphanica]|uniref:Uncharacterized protein n=1 Tax=Lentinula raphanica TaxID=153919 RepID=A0AA38P1F8_9AGAR|nr:hypothetical protein F5878DRAFT_645034 [Lentinula raphanica]KAJ3968219.1 hypothetical protein EV361DRAFT_871013 [Lentinula raphanica]
MSETAHNDPLVQRLSLLTERALHKQHMIQADIDTETQNLQKLLATLIKSTSKSDLGAYNHDLLATLNSARYSIEGSLNRLDHLKNDVVSIRKEISQIRLLSIVNKLRNESTRDMTEDALMTEIINKASLLILSYVEPVDAETQAEENSVVLF